jgi:hypothetical protein
MTAFRLVELGGGRVRQLMHTQFLFQTHYIGTAPGAGVSIRRLSSIWDEFGHFLALGVWLWTHQPFNWAPHHFVKFVGLILHSEYMVVL